VYIITPSFNDQGGYTVIQRTHPIPLSSRQHTHARVIEHQRFSTMIPSKACIALFLTIACGTTTMHAFQPTVPFRTSSSSSSYVALTKLAAKNKKGGKGFGENPLSQKRAYEAKAPPTPAPAAPVAAAAPAKMSEQEKKDQEEYANSGKAALNELRRRRSEERDEELRALRELRSVEDTLKEDPGAASIPEKVAMRMGKRMLPFVGIPLFGSMAAFIGFWYMATYRDLEFQPALVAASTIAFLAIGLVGITYSVISSSWDEDREGSALGFDEFQTNMGNLKAGLSRSSSNAMLREKAAGLSEEEVQNALRDLDRRERKKEEEELIKKEGLKGKLERELE